MSSNQGARITYPVQLKANSHGSRGEVPASVYMAAYEVYSHLYGPQQALIEGECRGGFGVGEMIAFLYARSFPREQWGTRVQWAFNGMKVGS